jgi:hypothetical protein
MHKGGGSPSCGGSRCTDACQRFLLARSVSRRGGKPPPRLSPGRGKRERGRLSSLLPAGDFGPPITGGDFLASLCRFCFTGSRCSDHRLLLTPALSVPHCFHTHSLWDSRETSLAKLRCKLNIRLDRGCYLLLDFPNTLACSAWAMVYRPFAQSPGYRRRQSVARSVRGKPSRNSEHRPPKTATDRQTLSSLLSPSTCHTTCSRWLAAGRSPRIG